MTQVPPPTDFNARLVRPADDSELSGMRLGAVLKEGETFFRVWAPGASHVEVVMESPTQNSVAMRREPHGYFSAALRGLAAGALYKYSVDGGHACPDPCSRFQPEGPHGPSMIVEPDNYPWRDAGWPGVRMQGQIIYELHVGTFTAEGTFDAAAEHLQYLQALGVTLVELMPVAECPGRWNWGYDGVQLYAPYHVYGPPDALRRFVDKAHGLGLGVILDVVYNHLGPDGNYLKQFSPFYFNAEHGTEWGEGLNFDGEESHGVREFFIGNACYWVSEFHLDGFRLDATQSIKDESPVHVLAEMTARVRQLASPRSVVFVAENEPQRGEQLLPIAAGGFGLDGMWNDDFHHSARVALTGSRDGYFADYSGRAQELLSAVKRGFLFQGQHYSWQDQSRGSPMPKVPAWACVHFLQNHDQVANTFVGERLNGLAMAARYRAMTALLLLGPQTPLLFMGQEFASSKPFMFFAEHHGELAAIVHKGRREFVAQFTAYATTAAQALVQDPAQQKTFLDSKLDWSEASHNTAALHLHRSLLRLRREDPVISKQQAGCIDGATLSEQCLVLRWFDAAYGDRLLVVNLGPELREPSIAEPLLGPPSDRHWQTAWASEDPACGGQGAIDPVSVDQRWHVQANSAVLLTAAALLTKS